MDQCKPSGTPADLILKLQTAQNRDEEMDQRIYRSLVGSFLYLAKQTRPDINFTVNILPRHMNAPTNEQWMCGKRLLRYLQSSKVLKLTYIKKALYDLVGKSDADWSGDVNDRKSTTAYYFKLNGREAALSWGVKKQATNALSSSEAEYQGMAAAFQEALYLKQHLEDFGIQQKHPIVIGEDNQSYIKFCQNTVMHKRSKQLETNFHFIRDKTEDGSISIHYVPTPTMYWGIPMPTQKCFVCAGIFFKPLISYQSQDARSGGIASLSRKKLLHETLEGNSGKTNTRK